MRYFSCTVLVAVPDRIHKDWSDGGDEGFHLQATVNDAGGYNPRSIKYHDTAAHLTTCERMTGAEFKKARNKGCWPEGGV